ncbi:MAG: FtsW/RodA/SpoVE family cell cycle protein [Melioribacter sp.]|uniref:FtsW/RodA/SpoVE family cell cycle protein n=1 Tax=Rosettibacter primus TaxID=3111523 RepID=UPI00247ED8A7|nr:FtsW/RodA/SpoVE family cell cycle protein [Melioribacter sp.]
MMRLMVKIMITIVVALMFLGAIMVFTASGTYSLSKFNNFYFLFKSHLWKVFAAIILMFVFAAIPYDYYRKLSKWLMIITIILLVITYFWGVKTKGAGRWLDVAGLFKFQPSELAKFLLIIHLSALIERKKHLIKDFKNGFLYALVWIGLTVGWIIIQPHVSVSIIIILTSFAILYVGGAQFKHIVSVFAVTAAIFVPVVLLYNHARQRVMDYINSLITGGDINIQVTQAKIALGSGGWSGLGFGNSRQSDLFLPESYGDFIFSVIGEEIGFIGTLVILILYFTLFFACLMIAKKSQDKFGQLLVFGLSFQILISAFINIGVVTGLLPTTGIPLPFISFGGTSIILSGISIGIILNVAQQSLRTEELKLAQVG